jgi:ubiquinone biosynthesis protein COQ4
MQTVHHIFMTDISPYIDPKRMAFDAKIRPFKAFRHMRNLIADKEDTTQVFYIIEALNGRMLLNDLKTFVGTEKGREMIEKREALAPILDDHVRWEALPEGSVGRAYLHFMQSQGLSAQGLIDEYERYDSDFSGFDDGIEWYANRRRDTHDLLHVLTGYSRDAFGEACVLAFTDGQHKDRGARFIAYMAAREVKKQAPKGAPVFKAIRAAQKHGRAAAHIILEDIPSLMSENLIAARERLNIAPPVHYTKTHAAMREHGINPFDVIGSGEGADQLLVAA